MTTVEDINEFFITKKSRKKFEKIIDQSVKLATDFKLGISDNPLVNYKEQSEIKKLIYEDFPSNETQIDKILEEFKEKILDGSVNWSWPGFMAFPDSNNSIAGTIGHIIQGMTSQNLCNSVHISPTATFVEIQLIKWMREALGYKVKNIDSIFDVGGIYTPGGVLSNTISLLLAREKKFSDTMKKGLTIDPKKAKLFLPDGIGHYSSRTALGWLGIGTDNVIKVKLKDGFKYDLDDLETKIIESKKRGEIPFAVVCYAGDSRTMTIDNFDEISRISKKHDLWMHVDACHGSALAFSKKYKHLIDGIEKADSITLDPHKIFWLPYNLSYVLLKNPEEFKLISGASDLITNEPFSLGQISPFIGSWGFHGLKLWFLFKNMGLEKISQQIDHRTDFAKQIQKMIANVDDFILMNDVVINSVTFVYLPRKYLIKMKNNEDFYGNLELINKLNKNIRETLFEKYDYFVHCFPLKDASNKLKFNQDYEINMMRIMVSNPILDESKFKDFINVLRKVSKLELEKIENEFCN
ncbi:MAG: pyridoxal-dependent decarboxylase [Nanoarchaeota archaeon]|nr:pyridoxal-dependent decarboxylase [Nanoarchaeota archaeon]